MGEEGAISDSESDMKWPLKLVILRNCMWLVSLNTKTNETQRNPQEDS